VIYSGYAGGFQILMKHHEIKAPTILEPELLNKVFVVREAAELGGAIGCADE